MVTRAEPPEPAVDELKRRARRRLVGAIVLALAAAVVLPMLLESDPKPFGDDVAIKIPPIDSGKFINPLSPETPPEKLAPASPAKTSATGVGASNVTGDAPRRPLERSIIGGTDRRFFAVQGKRSGPSGCATETGSDRGCALVRRRKHFRCRVCGAGGRVYRRASCRRSCGQAQDGRLCRIHRSVRRRSSRAARAHWSIQFTRGCRRGARTGQGGRLR